MFGGQRYEEIVIALGGGGETSFGGKFHMQVFCTDRELCAAAFCVESGQRNDEYWSFQQ